MNLLAAEMLNRNLVELDALNVLGDFLFDLLGRRVVLKGELADFVLDKRGGVIRCGSCVRKSTCEDIMPFFLNSAT